MDKLKHVCLDPSKMEKAKIRKEVHCPFCGFNFYAIPLESKCNCKRCPALMHVSVTQCPNCKTKIIIRGELIERS